MPIHLFLGIGLALSFLPLVFMINLSVKSPGQVLVDPLGVTLPLHLDNYVIAFNVLRRSMINSVVLTALNVVGSLVLATLAAFAISLLRFRGRRLVYWAIIGLLFIPSILTFAPRFVLVSQLGMRDTFPVLVLPYIAGAQVFEIFILVAFFRSISREVIEAAMLDGAGPLALLWKIVLPLSKPILATLAVLRALDNWNEWLWPLVTVSNPAIRPVALQVLYLSSDIGADLGRQMAGYAIASVPMLVLFALMTRQFVQGLTSGAVKV